MAGDWTPVEHATPRKPEMMNLVALTGRSRHECLGLMVEFWLWAEANTEDGRVATTVDVLPAFIGADKEFWDAVVRVGWIEIAEDGSGITIPRAEHWLTKGAKARLKETRKKQTQRKPSRRPDSVPDLSPKAGDKNGTTEQNRTEDSVASATETPKPPWPNSEDYAARDEPDWSIIEPEFIARWNTLDGVAVHNRNSLGGPTAAAFRDAWRDPEWRNRCAAAMQKFPLQNGVKMGLRKFLEPDTIDEILGGVHDFTKGRNGSDPGRTDPARHRSGDDFSALLAERIAGKPP